MQNRIAMLRRGERLSQADLARRLSVSRQSINAIETGRSDPSLALAFRIAELFGQSVEEVFAPPSRHQSRAV
jgi:putative transcriptional regulator